VGKGKGAYDSNFDILLGAEQFASPCCAALLVDHSAHTALEGRSCPWHRVLDDITAGPAPTPSQAVFRRMARVFDTGVAPLARQAPTREQQWRNWKGVVTIALAFDVVDQLGP
jgi:hypothetical protein